MRWFLAIALLSGGCVFKVRSVDAAMGGGDDFGVVDDLAFGGDDMGDQGTGGPPDLTPGSDLMPPVLMLSHVPQHYLTDGTCDLTVTTSIDTTAHKVDGNDPPAGCVFVDQNEPGPPSVDVSVLAVRSVVFNGTIKVTGAHGLVVVAGTTIQLNGTLDGSADMTAAGPGGFSPALGAGAGPSGKHSPGGMTFADSGGSGASFGTVGGNGGAGSYQGADAASPGTSMSYGSMYLTASAPGGSGGGTGSSEACNNKNGGNGGAGGGSIQLSAGTSITIGAGGMINVGGGGGAGGCEPATTDEGSGGGGGSGGSIFLESPSVSVSGGLWANGGSGGGGASGDVLNHQGQDGHNATTTTTGATGGPAGGTFGGNGGDGYPPSSATAANGANSANGGGGGGGAGRIVVRSRGAATITMSNVSPPPALDPAIP